MSLLKNILPVFLLPLVAGAGCAVLPTLSSPHIADPIFPPGSNLPVTQVQGFGEIPKPQAPPIRPGITGSIQITAAFPDVPGKVTVLRLPSGYLNTDELRNITSALQIPGSSLGANPALTTFELGWKDARGFSWMYDPAERKLSFTAPISSENQPAETPATAKQLLETVAVFMDDNGIKRGRYTEPYLQPASASPAHVFVMFDATQDGQAILNQDGTPVQGASFLVHRTSRNITSGFIRLSTDPERSDYPGISQDEARERLARGGQGGTPHGDVTVSQIKFEWMPMEDTKAPPTAYLYPALVGYGTIRYPDGSGSSYKVVVPLVK